MTLKIHMMLSWPRCLLASSPDIVTGRPGQGDTVPVDGTLKAVRSDALPTASRWQAMSSEDRRPFAEQMIRNLGGGMTRDQVIDRLTTYWKTTDDGK